MEDILQNYEKRALVHVAILDLIERANKENWGYNERLHKTCRQLLDIEKTLSAEVEKELTKLKGDN